MTKFLKEQPQQLEEYDDLLVRRLIEMIKRRLMVGVRPGIQVEKEV